MSVVRNCIWALAADSSAAPFPSLWVFVNEAQKKMLNPPGTFWYSSRICPCLIAVQNPRVRVTFQEHSDLRSEQGDLEFTSRG